MTRMGAGPHQIKDIAKVLGYKSSSSLGSLTQRLLRKGVVYNVDRGLYAFTVPHFDAYMVRVFGP